MQYKWHMHSAHTKYTLAIGSLVSFLFMGFALANHYISIWAQPCTFGILIHAAYFVMLYCFSHNYGTTHTHQLLLSSLSVLLSITASSWGILYIWPPADSTLAKVALWEQRIPIDTIVPFGISLFAYAINSLWTLKKPKQHILQKTFATLFIHMLCVAILHISNLQTIYPTSHFVGFSLVSIATLFIGYIGQRMRYKNQAKATTYDGIYQALVCFFCGICLATNLLVVKHITIYGSSVTAAVFIYALTFTCTDILSELYGHTKTLAAMWSGLLTNVMVFCFVFIGRLLPLHPQVSIDVDHTYQATFGFVGITILASMIAYVIAQILDIHLFAYLRTSMQGKYLWLRNNAATILSQMVDTSIFALLAWQLWMLFPTHASGLTWQAWWRISWHEYCLKVGIALCDTPIVYLLIALCKKLKRKPHKRMQA